MPKAVVHAVVSQTFPCQQHFHLLRSDRKVVRVLHQLDHRLDHEQRLVGFGDVLAADRLRRSGRGSRRSCSWPRRRDDRSARSFPAASRARTKLSATWETATGCIRYWPSPITGTTGVLRIRSASMVTNSLAGAEDQRRAEDRPVEVGCAHHSFGLPLGAVIAGGAAGTGAVGTHVQVATDPLLPGRGQQVAGRFDVQALEGDPLARKFADDADQVDDRVATGQRPVQGCRLGRVAVMDLDLVRAPPASPPSPAAPAPAPHAPPPPAGAAPRSPRTRSHR